MGARHVPRTLARLAPCASLLTLVACGSLLGIEDVHQGPAPGATGGTGGNGNGGDGITNPAGGTSQTGGGNSSRGGSSAQGGSGAHAGSSAQGGSVTIAEAGQAGQAAAGAAGSGMVGGTGVHGHVIDFWGHKVADVPVAIGGTLTTTDDQGAFSIDSVPAQYDVSLVVDFTGDYPRQIYGWVYQGLTRRDPTLQVYAGIARRSANILVTPANTVLPSNSTLTVALGGVDGSDEFTEVGANGIQTSTDWRGAPTTQETAHGLIWATDPTSGLPTKYSAYNSTLVALSDTTALTAINLDMTASAITSGNITGTITPATSTDRGNGLFLRFNSGATIKLADDTSGPNSFSYLVPTIPTSSVTLAAYEGDSYFGQYAVAHKDALAAGNSTITAAIPTPAKPLAPATGAVNVDASTQFSFVAGKGNAGAFVVAMIASQFYDGLYVVTTNKQFKLPEVVNGGYTLTSTHDYDWRIETHGDLATVDAMTGPTGFMDAFSADAASPIGSRKGDGSYTISQSNSFTAK